MGKEKKEIKNCKLHKALVAALSAVL